MANKDLEKGKQLLKDQVEEVGVLDNAFKSLSAVITTALEEAADSLSGIDTINQKIANSYKRDITSSLKNISKSLEKDVTLQMKINKGINVRKDIEKELLEIEAQRAILTEKLNQVNKDGSLFNKSEIANLNEVINLREEELKKLQTANGERQKNKSLFSILLENATSYADKIDETGTLTGILEGRFEEVLTASRLLEISMAFITAAFKNLDKFTGDLAKNLNISYSEANALQKELFIAAANSNSVFVTTKGMSESLGFINQQLGTSVMLNAKNLAIFTKLREAAGLTNEELIGINNLSLANGESLEDNARTIVNQVASLNRQTGIYLNEKEILKGIKDVSASTTLSLGKNPGLIAEAVATAKALGMELSKVDAIAGSLLDFESSISAELDAEMLLGRGINLEKARQAALNNDLATVAKEISKQAGTSAEFAAMNRIQQEAIAKAVGMGRDDLAQTLFVQEQLTGASEGESKRRELILNKRIEEVGLIQAKKDLEEGNLETLFQQASVQDRLSASLEKIQEAFMGIAILVTPLIEGFASMLQYISESKGALITIGSILGALVAKSVLLLATQLKLMTTSLINATSNIIGGSFKAGPLGLPIAIAGLGALAGGALAAKAITVDDAIIPPGYGDTIVKRGKDTIALNNDDTIVAGTNLGGGDNRTGEKTNQLLETLIMQNAKKPELSPVGLYEIQ
ncbi:MAG: hypothetical protein K0U55_12855 [Gammaproteobacteria bacterium]|nr:hypothetical protein [Gammaproteobacteria bacterium]